MCIGTWWIIILHDYDKNIVEYIGTKYIQIERFDVYYVIFSEWMNQRSWWKIEKYLKFVKELILMLKVNKWHFNTMVKRILARGVSGGN